MSDTSSHTSVVESRLRDRPEPVAIGVLLLTLGICLWELSVSRVLSWSDSGMYFASSLRLVNGSIPYRDFFFVQPPGITILMSPVAALSKAIGSHNGYTVVRALSGVATAANAGLIAWLVRSRGRITMAIAGVGLALFPLSALVSSSLKLEPFYTFFVLLGAVIVLSSSDKERPIPTKVLVIGGVLFGFAGLIKLWAIFPFVALVICLLPRHRQRVLTLIGSAAASFTLFALPFFIMAPRNFISQVFIDQLGRGGNASNDSGALWRLVEMTGFSQTKFMPSHFQAVMVFATLGILALAAFLVRERRSTTEMFVTLAVITTTFALMIAPENYAYYGYFTAPYLFAFMAICLSRLTRFVRGVSSLKPLSQSMKRFTTVAMSLLSVLLVAGGVLWSTTLYSATVFVWGLSDSILTPITKEIPVGSCVIFDQAFYGVMTNRLTSTDPTCPQIVDPNDMRMAWNNQAKQPSSFTTQWEGYFSKASYVVLSSPSSSYIPMNQELATWFHSHYHLLPGGPGVLVFKNNVTT